MAHYIDKSTLAAEINRRMKEHHSGYLVCLKDMLSLLDSLEVKEVDLEKEIDKELDNTWYGEYLNIDKFRESAKHFFELGLKTKRE